MRLVEKLVLVAAFLCSVSAPSHSAGKKVEKTDQPAPVKKEVAKWTDVEFGITEQELEKIRPDVQRMNNPRSVKSHYSNQEIPSYSAAGLNFRVLFFFDNQTKTLDEVFMRAKDVEGNIERACNNLNASLVEKYGPIVHKHRTGTYTISTVTQWTTPLLTVQLSCTTGDLEAVVISYIPKNLNTTGL